MNTNDGGGCFDYPSFGMETKPLGLPHAPKRPYCFRARLSRRNRLYFTKPIP